MGKFEAHRINEELLLDGEQRVIEKSWLRPIIRKSRRDISSQASGYRTHRRGEETAALGLSCLFGRAGVEGVGGVGGGVEGDVVLRCAVAVVVVNGDVRTVDGELLEIGAAVAVELGVEVGEEPALEEGVF
jgi:hypothetical protein